MTSRHHRCFPGTTPPQAANTYIWKLGFQYLNFSGASQAIAPECVLEIISPPSCILSPSRQGPQLPFASSS